MSSDNRFSHQGFPQVACSLPCLSGGSSLCWWLVCLQLTIHAIVLRGRVNHDRTVRFVDIQTVEANESSVQINNHVMEDEPYRFESGSQLAYLFRNTLCLVLPLQCFWVWQVVYVNSDRMIKLTGFLVNSLYWSAAVPFVLGHNPHNERICMLQSVWGLL